MSCKARQDRLGAKRAGITIGIFARNVVHRLRSLVLQACLGQRRPGTFSPQT